MGFFFYNLKKPSISMGTTPSKSTLQSSRELSDRIKNPSAYASPAQRQAAIESIPDDRIRRETISWYLVHLKTPAQRAAYIQRIKKEGRDRDDHDFMKRLLDYNKRMQKYEKERKQQQNKNRTPPQRKKEFWRLETACTPICENDRSDRHLH